MRVIEISCLEVWREVSNFIDGEVDAELRARMEAHFKGCAHCKAILDGTRNVNAGRVQLSTARKNQKQVDSATLRNYLS